LGKPCLKADSDTSSKRGRDQARTTTQNKGGNGDASGGERDRNRAHEKSHSKEALSTAYLSGVIAFQILQKKDILAHQDFHPEWLFSNEGHFHPIKWTIGRPRLNTTQIMELAIQSQAEPRW